MSVLSHQSAINDKRNFWLQSGTISSLTVNSLTVTGIENASTLNANSISSGILTSGGVEANTVSTIHFYADIINIDEATISSISTNAIELDGAYLNTAGGNELLLNGIPIATTANLSSIQDWAIFPAVSSILMANSGLDIGSALVPVREGYFSTIYANNAQIVSTILVPSETVSSLFVDTEFVSTSFTQVANIQQGNFSSISSGVLTSQVGSFSSLFATTGSISSLGADTGSISSFFANTASVSSFSFSTLNGLSLSNYQASNWSRYPAVTQVNMCNQNIVNLGNLNAQNAYVAGQLYGSDTRGNQGTFSNFINVGYFSNLLSNGYNFNVNTGGNVSCYDINAEDITCCNVEVGDPLTSLADVNIYGATALPGDNALYVEGGVEFDGGLIHGTAFGCLPAGGINTTRFSMTPAAGIVMITPIAISMNAGAVMNQAVGGAYSLAVGGVANLAAGTYMEINSGELKLINDTPIIFSANAGVGPSGGLNMNTYIDSKSLAINNLPFGIFENYKTGATYTISSGMSSIQLETIPLPSIGQWQIQSGFEFTLNSGNGKDANVDLYFSPVANPDFSYLAQGIFTAPITNILSNFKLTLGGAVGVSTITGSNLVVGSTISELISTNSITGSTLSTFTSSFFSSFVFEGGLNLYLDTTNASATFNATLRRGAIGASYLGSYFPSLQ